jgi:hypothetical protein
MPRMVFAIGWANGARAARDAFDDRRRSAADQSAGGSTHETA